jgi:hypothetical protein
MTERRARYGRQSSRKCEAFGITFDSKAERDRYLELRAMQEAGAIAGLAVHPKFELQPAFAMENGEKVRAITYTPDFEYVSAGVRVVEDVKAWMTDKRTGKRKPLVQEDCELKIKMLKHLRPDIEFRITGG